MSLECGNLYYMLESKEYYFVVFSLVEAPVGYLVNIHYTTCPEDISTLSQYLTQEELEELEVLGLIKASSAIEAIYG